MVALADRLNSLPTWKQQLYARAAKGDRLAYYWTAPHLVMEGKADPWQRRALFELVTNRSNVLMCCSRGAGKTQTFAAAAYVEACTVGGFAMILSRSDRQALRLIRRAKEYHDRLRLQPLVVDNMHEMEFANGGRILALPSSGDTIVGEHGVTLLGLDEAAKIKDSFYALVTPMLITSERVTGIKPRRALLSTPYGQRGFFYNEWEGKGRQDWVRYRTTWRDCPRIGLADIENERLSHSESWIRQEYECEFLGETGCYFDVDAVQGCIDDRWGDDSLED